MGECLDGYLISVPFEALKRAARDRKHALDALDAALRTLPPPPRPESAPRLLKALKDARARLEAASSQERDALHLLKARLAHLHDLQGDSSRAPPEGTRLAAARRRLPALLGDHLLRRGALASARALAAAAGCQPLLDLSVFAQAEPVLAALRRRDTGPALRWCEAHASRLKKARSPLAWRLCLQDAVERLRAGDAAGALALSRAHLGPMVAAQASADLASKSAKLGKPDFASASALVLEASLGAQGARACPPSAPQLSPQAKDLCALAGALALGPSAAQAFPLYASLLSPGRWEDLCAGFLAELERLAGLAPAGALRVQLWAGLAALKTPRKGGGGARADPLHLPAYAALARRLPFAKHGSSRLVCALSREPMDEHNAPMVFPNGMVYGERALRGMAARNGGRVVCPRTGCECALGELKRAFVS